ncbi:MAG: aminotransferase class V-fold PLP-dependent enzyme [SAR324 cluster bacterium]|nr:aminotransferase class V-fold PLP-dependent enzyme [SAR324 cluster bacterium]
MKILDTDFVRRQFPAFQHPETGQWAYFENAGGSYVPQSVIDHLTRFMVEAKVQPYGNSHPSTVARTMMEGSIIRMSEMINADHSEVLVGHCTTMNVYMLSRALGSWIRPGDEIIVSNQEHEANANDWHRLAENGVSVIEWKMNPETADLEVEALEKLLSRRTRLVCMTHSSNIVGSANDVKRVAELVHAKGGLLMVDGVSYAPNHSIDVKALEADFYVLSLYKTYGPHLGLLYVKKQHHDMLSNQYFKFLSAYKDAHSDPGAPNFLRIALNPGGANHEEAACLSGITDYYDRVFHHHFPELSETSKIDTFQRIEKVFDLFQNHLTRLSEIFLDYLQSNQRIRLIGKNVADSTVRSPTFSFTIAGEMSKQDLVAELAARKIAIASGNFYAWRCLAGIGIDPDEGVLRASFVHYNTEDEVRHLCSSLKEII